MTLIPAGYRHGLRVWVGAERGVLLRCDKRGHSGDTYWRIRLQNGEWVWPDRHTMVVDGPGTKLETCAECSLMFRTSGGSALCPTCDEIQFGTRARAHENPGDARDDRRDRRFHRGSWKEISK